MQAPPSGPRTTEAADGEAEDVDLAESHRGDERDSIARHLLDGVRSGASGPADAYIVERDDPPGR